jgi:hypothetical protein
MLKIQSPPHTKHNASPGSVMLFRKITANVYFEKEKKLFILRKRQTLCGENAEFLNVKTRGKPT